MLKIHQIVDLYPDGGVIPLTRLSREIRGQYLTNKSTDGAVTLDRSQGKYLVYGLTTCAAAIYANYSSNPRRAYVHHVPSSSLTVGAINTAIDALGGQANEVWVVLGQTEIPDDDYMVMVDRLTGAGIPTGQIVRMTHVPAGMLAIDMHGCIGY